jgi:hypothetical protein
MMHVCWLVLIKPLSMQDSTENHETQEDVKDEKMELMW